MCRLCNRSYAVVPVAREQATTVRPRDTREQFSATAWPSRATPHSPLFQQTKLISNIWRLCTAYIYIYIAAYAQRNGACVTIGVNRLQRLDVAARKLGLRYA